MDLPVDIDAVRGALRDHGVVFALLFGSHATARADGGSDIDLAVWAGCPIDDWRLRGALPDEVDLLDLTGAPDGWLGGWP